MPRRSQHNAGESSGLQSPPTASPRALVRVARFAATAGVLALLIPFAARTFREDLRAQTELPDYRTLLELAEGGTGQTLDKARLPVIDAHAHLVGDGIWPNVEAIMDTQNIAYFFNLSGGSPRQGMTGAIALSIDSGMRILNFMTINWDGFGEIAWGDTVAEELELAVTRYGYAGLKVSKALGLYVTDIDDSLVAVDDPRLFPIWERAGELGVPVFIHTGDPRAFWEPVTPANERFAELSAHPGWSFAGPEFPPREQLLAQRDHLLELFPQTTFVCLHFGNNPEDIDYVDGVLERYPNAYVDTAARVGEIGRHDPEVVRDLFMRHRDRILFATDIAVGYSRRRGPVLVLGSSGAEPDTPQQIPEFYARHWRFFETHDRGIPHPTPIQGDWTVDAIGLPADVLERVYYTNAYELVVEPWMTRNAIE